MNIKEIIIGCSAAVVVLAAGTVPVFAATASETVTTGGLTTTSPDLTFTSVAVTGVATQSTATYTLDVNDLSGNNAGWKVTLAGGALTNADSTTLATTATPSRFRALHHGDHRMHRPGRERLRHCPVCSLPDRRRALQRGRQHR
jgi:hypothetical protein